MLSGEAPVTASASGRRLVERFPRQPCSTCRGRTHGNERRLRIDQQSLACVEYGLENALVLEEEAPLEEVLTADAGMLSIEMPMGNIQDLLNSLPSGRISNIRSAST